jgi:hypothetical protein
MTMLIYTIKSHVSFVLFSTRSATADFVKTLMERLSLLIRPADTIEREG